MKKRVHKIKWFEKNYHLALVLAVITGAFIFWVSSLSFPKGPFDPWAFLMSTGFHFIIYVVFSFFMIMAIVRTKSKNSRTILFLSLLLATAYAVTDELHQFYVPGRACDLGDFFIDFAGIISAGLLYLLLGLDRLE